MNWWKYSWRVRECGLVRPKPPRSPRINRRAFLYGLGGVGIGLPFLESAPERSAWGAGEEPVFALFMGTSNGIIADSFWPAELGPLTNLSGEAGATGILGDFAEQLIFARGLRYPGPMTTESHGQSYPQMLTGALYVSSGKPLWNAGGPSIDVILAPLLNSDGAEPMTLYSAARESGYIAEAMSWDEAGNLRAVEPNPYAVYQRLVGGAGTDPNVLTNAVLVRRQSAIDLARDELLTFQGRTNISKTDHDRLEQHLSALRQLEQALGEVAPSTCSAAFLDVAGIEAVKETYSKNGMVEIVSKLHLELTAFAFACNLNHVATLQSGAGLDSTKYDVPNGLGWTFHHISHQVQSDSAAGDNPLAVQDHIAIDRLRIETLAHGLRKFASHGLLDKSILMWTNQFCDGRSGAFNDLPYIIAGNPYGRLKSGQFVDCNNSLNGELLTTVANALGVDRLIGSAERVIDELLV